jgi:hypothetical protein
MHLSTLQQRTFFKNKVKKKKNANKVLFILFTKIQNDSHLQEIDAHKKQIRRTCRENGIMKKGAEGKRKENKHNENAIWGVLSTD